MLAAHVDALFDSFNISFDLNGVMQISKELNIEEFEKLGIDITKQISLDPKYLPYIEWHLNIFKDKQKNIF